MTQVLDLTIVIVNYNTPNWVEKCLVSLDKFVVSDSAYQIKVMVVDNGSEEDSLNALVKVTKKFSFVEVVKSETNLGFAGGNNIALKQIKSRYVMLLNSDTEATAQTHIEKLIGYMDEHLEVAVVSPRVELSDGGLDWAS